MALPLPLAEAHCGAEAKMALPLPLPLPLAEVHCGAEAKMALPLAMAKAHCGAEEKMEHVVCKSGPRSRALRPSQVPIERKVAPWEREEEEE